MADSVVAGSFERLPAVSPRDPAPKPHAVDAESGRGLEIVSMLSDEWGCYHPDGGGKVVWAVLDISAAPGVPPVAGT